MDNHFLIIMPVYNSEPYVESSIMSVLKQSYTNWTLVIVDDASTDSSKQICRSFSDLYDNIHLICNDVNLGCYCSRNIALKYAVDINLDWDAFTVHDSDDVSHIDRLKVANESFIPYTSYVRLPARRIMDENFDFSSYVADKTDLLNCDGVVFFNRIIFNMLGYYDFTDFGGDSEYISRINRLCDLGFAYTPNIRCDLDTIYYLARTHDRNLTSLYNKSIRNKYRSKYMAKIVNTSNRSDLFYPYKRCMLTNKLSDGGGKCLDSKDQCRSALPMVNVTEPRKFNQLSDGERKLRRKCRYDKKIKKLIPAYTQTLRKTFVKK